MDIRLALMTGAEIPIEKCQVILHQPSLKEISYIGESIFFEGAQILCITKDMVSSDKSLTEDISNFQIFMTIMTDPATKSKKKVVMKLFTIVFPDYKVMITPRTIIFEKDGENINVDESNFDELQSVMRSVCCLGESTSSATTYNVKSKKGKEIAEKLMKGRKKAAAAKNKNKGNSSVFVQYLSILSVGLHMSLLDLVNLTMYQIYDLMERFGLYQSWDLDVKSRLAGAKPKKEAENWMKEIH